MLSSGESVGCPGSLPLGDFDVLACGAVMSCVVGFVETVPSVNFVHCV